MTGRRGVLGKLLAGPVVGASHVATDHGQVLGASNCVRVGPIGAGGRGKEILKAAMRCPDTEAAAVADVRTRRPDELKAFAPAAWQSRRAVGRGP